MREQFTYVVAGSLFALLVLLLTLTAGIWRFASVWADDGWRAALQSVDLSGVGLAAGGFATVAGVAIAALVGYHKFNLFREGHPHLTIDLTASHRQVSPRYIHIGATARLSNTSKVVVIISTATWDLTSIAPYADAVAGRLKEVFVRGYQHDGDEFGMSVQNQVTSRFDLRIEPGETDQITFDFITEEDLESVAITLFINNEAESSATRQAGWGRRIFYDLAD